MANKKVRNRYVVVIREYQNPERYYYRMRGSDEIEAVERGLKLHAYLCGGEASFDADSFEVYRMAKFDFYKLFGGPPADGQKKVV